jgi:hypothetical protein
MQGQSRLGIPRVDEDLGFADFIVVGSTHGPSNTCSDIPTLGRPFAIFEELVTKTMSE